MTEIVNALVFRKEKILLVKRSPHRRNYPGKWSFPGGHVEAGESIEDALKRELMEELAIRPTDYAFLQIIADPNALGAEVNYHIFAVTAWEEGEPTLQGSEHTEFKWVYPVDAISTPDLALSAYLNLFRQICS
ncbi:NUDIX hydrolase [Pelagibius sp. Alg239-R121]|uniref:NUDIX hydrolase n=1 Tax=Pelagibius sp. Alg239-R121 TaxID=2993448 RepID=UPI0024A676C0|nr:NUDIX domain-containing protein [Pelagibius sp. Alg239-R121]